VDILHDGVHYLRVAVTDLMDRAPRTVDDRSAEGLPTRIASEWRKLDWVKDCRVRLREHGHVFFGEGFIEPTDRKNLIARTQEAVETAYRLDWRLQEIVVQLTDAAAADDGSSVARNGFEHEKHETEHAGAESAGA
jgi:hypothetical protein